MNGGRPDLALFDQGYRRALALLHACNTGDGFLASPSQRDNSWFDNGDGPPDMDGEPWSLPEYVHERRFAAGGTRTPGLERRRRDRASRAGGHTAAAERSS